MGSQTCWFGHPNKNPAKNRVKTPLFWRVCPMILRDKHISQWNQPSAIKTKEPAEISVFPVAASRRPFSVRARHLKGALSIGSDPNYLPAYHPCIVYFPTFTINVGTYTRQPWMVWVWIGWFKIHLLNREVSKLLVKQRESTGWGFGDLNLNTGDPNLNTFICVVFFPGNKIGRNPTYPLAKQSNIWCSFDTWTTLQETKMSHLWNRKKSWTQRCGSGDMLVFG